MKVSREVVARKKQYVISRLARSPGLTLNELQRRIKSKFGGELRRATLRDTVKAFLSTRRMTALQKGRRMSNERVMEIADDVIGHLSEIVGRLV